MFGPFAFTDGALWLRKPIRKKNLSDNLQSVDFLKCEATIYFLVEKESRSQTTESRLQELQGTKTRYDL